jgi:hypothetical protein
MNLSLFQQTKPVGAGHSLVMAISKKSAQNIILHYFELPLAYTGQTQLHTFAGIDNVMWYYQLFESPDGTPTGVVRNYFDVEPNANTYASRDDLYLVADIDDFLDSNTSGYGVDPLAVDTSLVGWNWSLERVGQGTRQVGVKYAKTKVVGGVVTDTTNDDVEATGFRLLDIGDLVGPNEEWCIHFYPQLQAVSTPTTSGVISATRILTANTTLDNTGIGQSFWLKGAGGYFEVTLPDLATVPDNEPIYFMSDGGSHVNVGLKCFAGQSIQWYKNAADLSSDTRATRIVMGQQQKLTMYKVTLDDSSVRWLILGGFEDRKVGQIISHYTKIPINTIFADGSEISRSVYVALWEQVQVLQALTPAAVVTKTAWETTQTFDGVNYKVNYGKYHLGDGSTTFGVPRLYAGAASGVGFLRLVDGTGRLPTSFQVDAYPSHQHEDTIGTLTASLFGKGPTRTKGNYNGLGSGPTDLSGPPGLVVGSAFQDSQKLSYESRPANFGVYGLINI